MSTPDCGFNMCRMNGRYVFVFMKYGATYEVQLKVLPAVKGSQYTVVGNYTVPEAGLDAFINTVVASYTA